MSNNSRPRIRFWTTVLLSLTMVLVISGELNSPFPPTEAHHAGVPTLSAYGAPTIDGQISAAEYASCYGPTSTGSAGTYTQVSPGNPPITAIITSTESRQLTFCESNDQSNDYYAFQISGVTNSSSDTMYLLFDNNHDGAVSNSCNPGAIEDALGFIPTGFGLPVFMDMAYCGVPSGTQPSQVPVSRDVILGGTQNGGGVVTYSVSNGYVFEFSHPMSSTDAYDYALSAGSTFGWCIYFWDATINFAWDYPIDCYYYYAAPNTPPAANANLYGDIKKLPSSSDNCDLAINKTVAPIPLQSGQTATINITVTNVGTAPCPEPGPTTVTDSPPPVLTVNSASGSTGSGWNCQITPAVICTNANTILPGQSTTITVIATVSGTPGTGLQNCAQVNNPHDMSPPNNPANNISCVTAIIVPEFPQGSGILLAAIGFVLVFALVRPRKRHPKIR